MLFPILLFCVFVMLRSDVFMLFIILSLTDTGFTFFLRSTGEEKKKPTHNHLLISAEIPVPPAA